MQQGQSSQIIFTAIVFISEVSIVAPSLRVKLFNCSLYVWSSVECFLPYREILSFISLAQWQCQQ